MDLEEFRRHAHSTVDWMVDYLKTVEARPILPNVQPGEIVDALPEAAPQQPESMDAILRDFERLIVPGMTHWQNPSFFAYFPANSSPPSILAEMLVTTMGAQCMSWATSPAATELEEVVMNWLRQLIGLPDDFVGVIQDTASTATLCALLCARERATQWQSNEHGMRAFSGVRGSDHDVLTVYASEHAHSSVEKGVKIAGYGRANLRLIDSDAAFAMDPAALDLAITRDLRAGRKPACVVASLGTTGSAAIDPLAAIAQICKRHGVWLHVDAAYGGSALVCPETRSMLASVEHADSFVFNPHKWLLTNFDCSAYFVRDVAALVRTFEILPEYLKTQHSKPVRNLRDWGIQLGRRFRALKLWFVLRSYGSLGLAQIIRGHMQLAKELGSWVQSSDDFELLAPVSLGLVCLRYHPKGIDDAAQLDALNERLLAAVNATGSMYVTHTRLRGEYVIRVAIGATNTSRVHVERAWLLLQESARALR